MESSNCNPGIPYLSFIISLNLKIRQPRKNTGLSNKCMNSGLYRMKNILCTSPGIDKFLNLPKDFIYPHSPPILEMNISPVFMCFLPLFQVPLIRDTLNLISF